MKRIRDLENFDFCAVGLWFRLGQDLYDVNDRYGILSAYDPAMPAAGDSVPTEWYDEFFATQYPGYTIDCGARYLRQCPTCDWDEGTMVTERVQWDGISNIFVACVDGCPPERLLKKIFEDMEPVLAPRWLELRQSQDAAENARKRELAGSMSAEFLLGLDYATEWVIDGLIPRNNLTLLAGAPGVGKTMIAMSWAIAIATGTPWLGRDVRQGRTMLVLAEGSPRDHARRFAGLAAGRSLKDVFIYNGKLHVDVPESLSALYNVIGELGVKTLIIDNLSQIVTDRATNAENDASAMGPVMARIEGLARSGITVILLHHAGVTGTPRGSSVIRAAVDHELRIDGSAIETHKTRSGERGSVRYRIVDTDDGIAILPRLLPRAGKPRGKKEQQLLDLLAVGPRCAEEIYSELTGSRTKILAARNALIDSGEIKFSDGIFSLEEK